MSESKDFDAEDLRDLRDQFNKIDTDKSGSIDHRELGNLISQLGEKVDEKKLKEIIAEVDKDKSGAVDFEEFLHVVKSVRAGKLSSGMAKVYQKERDAASLQKKTFTVWCNTHLQSKDKSVEIKDLFTDLRDGIILCKLVEVLADKKIKYNPAPKLLFNQQENASVALKQLQQEGIKLVNIGPADVTSGTPTTILGLIWTIILFYQMQGLGGEGVGAKAALLQWVHKQLEPYPSVELPQNFGVDFGDGKAMATLVHRLCGGPNSGPYNQEEVMKNNPLDNHEIAFATGLSRLEVPRMLDPQDMVIPKPDENSVMTYVACLKNAHDKLRAKRALKPEAYGIQAPKTGEAGVAVHFKIAVVEPKDAKAGPDSFVVVLETPDGKFATPATMETSAGPSTTSGYGASCLPLVAGVNRIRVTINGEDISSSPHVITISEGKKTCDRASSTTIDEKTCVAGLPCSFVIQAADFCGNNKKDTGGAVFAAEVRGGGLAAPIACQAHENGNGTTTVKADKLPQKPGKYELAVGLLFPTQAAIDQLDADRKAAGTIIDRGGSWPPKNVDASIRRQPSKVMKQESNTSNIYLFVGNTPVSFTVAPGPNGGKSTCSGEGLSNAVAGKPAHFMLTTKDENGNPITKGGLGDSLAVLVTGPDGKSPTKVAAPKITDNNNGTYSVTFVPEKSGPNSIVVKIHNDNVAGSPFTCLVVAGDADPNHTVVSGPGLTACHVAEPAEFKVECRDAFDNPCSSHPVTVEVMGGTNGNKPISTQPVVSPADGNVRYTADDVGPHKIMVKLNGTPIKNAPFTAMCSSGLASHLHTTAEGPGLHSAAAGADAVFTVTTKDAKGNLTTNNEPIAVVVHYPSGKTAQGVVTNNNNGTHSCSYAPEESGALVVDVLLGSNHIKDSPFKVSCQAGAADPSKSTASGSGLDGAVAGEPALIKVTLRDKDGNQPSHGGEASAIAVVCEGPQGKACKPSQIKDNGDGTYDAVFYPEEAGSNKVQLKLNGQNIQGFPATVAVVAGAADPSQTTAEGPGLVGGNVGEQAPFKINYKDKCGNPCGLGGASVAVEVVNPNGGAAQQPAQVDGPSGNVSYVPEDVGQTKVTVKLNGQPIQHSPFMVQITAGAPSASTTTAEGPGLVSAAAGVEAVFTVTTKDSSGHLCPHHPGTVVAFSVQGPSGQKGTGKVHDNKDGTFSCSYVASESGPSVIDVQLSNQPIKDSPFHVNVLAGKADPNQSSASGSGLGGAVAGEPAVFKVTLKDKDGNQPQQGGSAAEIGVVCHGPNGKAVGRPAEIVDNNDGTYDVTYYPEEAGSNKVQLKLNGANVVGAPYDVPVVAGEADASHTTAEGPGLLGGVEGCECPFTITTYDRFGNKCTRSAATAVFDIQVGPEGAKGTVHDNGNGTYAAAYVPTVGGKHHVSVLLNEHDIKGSTFQVNITSIAELMAENAALLAQIASVREHRNKLIDAVDNDKAKETHCQCGLPHTMECGQCKKTFNTKEWLQKKFPGWQLRTGFP